MPICHETHDIHDTCASDGARCSTGILSALSLRPAEHGVAPSALKTGWGDAHPGRRFALPWAGMVLALQAAIQARTRGGPEHHRRQSTRLFLIGRLSSAAICAICGHVLPVHAAFHPLLVSWRHRAFARVLFTSSFILLRTSFAIFALSRWILLSPSSFRVFRVLCGEVWQMEFGYRFE